MPFKSRLDLRVWWIILVFGWSGAVRVPSECSFQDGRCLYQISLNPVCNDPGDLETNSIQNDYDKRVNNIEKSIVDVRVDHARRIEELESRLAGALPGSGYNYKWEKNNNNPYLTPSGENEENPYPDLDSDQRIRHGHGENKHGHIFTNEPDGPGHHGNQGHNNIISVNLNPSEEEDRLLALLYQRFKGIRKDLAQCERRSRDQARQLRDTHLKLNRTQTMLAETTSKFLNAESELAKSKQDTNTLREELQIKDSVLNETKSQLQDSVKEVRTKNFELWDLRGENERLRKELESLREMLEFTRRQLAEALRKYHELNVEHEKTVVTLHNRTQDLYTCYNGKTATFCSFEDESICGFEQANGTDFMDWTRHRLRTPSARTGPRADHTCGNKNGFYMYVEASARGEGQTAQLVSPRYQGYGEQCVEFYYHMYGRHTGTLNVYTLLSNQEEFMAAWRAFGDQGDVWTMARLPIPADVAQQGYQVIFEGTLEKGFEGDIAIDDFRVFDGVCYVTTPPANTNTTTASVQTTTTAAPVSPLTSP